jgi:hypothetical protein
MFQEILAFIALGIAIAFLLRKLFFKKKKPNKNCDASGCDCH